MVIDASVAVQACLGEAGFDELGGVELEAPPLMWVEAGSALHELRWRRELSERLTTLAFEALREAPVKRRGPRRLLERAWEVADELGWAKLYDAHYVALARVLEVPLLTLDERLRRGASRAVEVLGPTELRR